MYVYILGFPPQRVTTAAEGSSIAGHRYTLMCTATRDTTLKNATMELVWLNSDRNTVSSTDSISITGPTSTANEVLVSRLTFSVLRTSNGGTYTCQTSLTIPDVVTEHLVNSSQDVIVQSE